MGVRERVTTYEQGVERIGDEEGLREILVGGDAVWNGTQRNLIVSGIASRDGERNLTRGCEGQRCNGDGVGEWGRREL